MIKTILSTVTIATLVSFSGCSAITDNPIANAVKGTAGAVTDTAKGAVNATTGAVSGATDTVTGSSLKDKAVDKAVETADGKTNGAASKVMNVVK